MEEAEVNLKGLRWESVNLHTGREGHVGGFSFTRDCEGRVWVVWDLFTDRREAIVAQLWDEEELSHPHRLSVSSSCYRPQVASGPEGDAFTVWSSKRGGGWGLYCSLFDGEEWSEEYRISREDEDALSPSIGTDLRGNVWVVWEAHRGGGSAIKTRAFRDGRWLREVRVSGRMRHNFRPVVAVGRNGDVHIVWDSYSNGTYNIYSRSRIGGEWTDIMRVSSDSEWEFIPALTLDASQRAWAAWLRSADVANADGVVDQWPTVRCARFDGVGWSQMPDRDGGLDLAALCHGLLPKVHPVKTGVWGYLGRRRRPMLMPDGSGGVWLLWERKEAHDGSTTKTTGLLCGRLFDGHTWSPEVILHRGHLFYSTPNSGSVLDEKMWICTRGALEETLGDIHILSTEWPIPEGCPRFRLGEWSGWFPLDLVGFRESVRRRTVVVRGVKYRLYWGDLHCHSVLSADAEGELDELLFYARDKAGLDFCAITDNDCYLMPMSNSDWFLSQHYSMRFNSPGRFIVFSGYEWTKRNGDGLPYNHRTVLYQTDDQPIFRWTEPPSRRIEGLSRCIEGTNGMMQPHHQKWRLSASERERNVEVCSGWAVYIDEPEWIHRHLAEGYRFGFVGGGDSHRRNPGLCGSLTGVFARAFTREAIFEALKSRRAYATNGSRIFLDFRVDDAFMGEECRSRGAPKIRVQAEGTKRPISLEVVRNGETIHTVKSSGREISLRYVDGECPRGWSYYYVKVAQGCKVPSYPSNVAVAKGNRAWSSPVWVYR